VTLCPGVDYVVYTKLSLFFLSKSENLQLFLSVDVN